jgi:hypothetical protein
MVKHRTTWQEVCERGVWVSEGVDMGPTCLVPAVLARLVDVLAPGLVLTGQRLLHRQAVLRRLVRRVLARGLCLLVKLLGLIG